MTATPSRRARAGSRWSTGLAGDLDRAGVRAVRAGDRLDQGGLAGPVLADDRVDLAGQQLERHALERADAAEALGDVGEPEKGGHLGCPRSVSFEVKTWSLKRPCRARS
jgi:hypothetical protein